MSKPERPRYLPPRTGRSKWASPPPRWFVREAVSAFDLSAHAVVAMIIIADNLDDDGASRTSASLIAQRGNTTRETVRTALDQLLEHGVIFELDPRGPGRIMRYAIAAEMPWHPKGTR